MFTYSFTLNFCCLQPGFERATCCIVFHVIPLGHAIYPTTVWLKQSSGSLVIITDGAVQ